MISNSRQLLSQAVFSRWASSSQTRIAAKPAAISGEAQLSPLPRGQLGGCQPRRAASRCTISPHTMNGQKEHQSRPTRGKPSRISGHHQAQKMLRAPLWARSWGPSQSQRFTSTNTQLTRPNIRPFQSRGERSKLRSSGFQRQRSKRSRVWRLEVQNTSSGSCWGSSLPWIRRACCRAR